MIHLHKYEFDRFFLKYCFNLFRKFTGEPLKIHISEEAKNVLELFGNFLVVPRGEIEIKVTYYKIFFRYNLSFVIFSNYFY